LLLLKPVYSSLHHYCDDKAAGGTSLGAISLFSLVPCIALRSHYQSLASGDVGFGPPHQGSGNLTLIVEERVSSNETLHHRITISLQSLTQLTDFCMTPLNVTFATCANLLPSRTRRADDNQNDT
jgi:hypothetical protein